MRSTGIPANEEGDAKPDQCGCGKPQIRSRVQQPARRRNKQRNEWAGERNGEPDRQRDKHSSRRSGRQCDWRGRGLCDGRRRRGDVYGDLDVERRLNLVPEKI